MGYKKKFKPLTEEQHLERIVKPIFNEMDNGNIPWHKPWETSQNSQGEIVAGVQRSLSSGNLYEGINALVTQMVADEQGFKNRYWGTYAGIKKIGGQVKKGQRAMYVVKWDFTKVVVGDSNCRKCQGKRVFLKGKAKACTACEPVRTYNSIKIYSNAVWNLDQAEFAKGLPEQYQPPKPKKVKKLTKKQEQARVNKVIKSAQAVVDAYVPNLAGGMSDEKIESNRAYYSPSRDAVVVPARKQFPRPEAYYRVAFHELVHSTGHKSRLDRFSNWTSHMFGSHDYSKEEFVAEIGACALASFLGCDTTVDIKNSGAYLRSWKKSLKNNKKDVVFAIGASMKAINLIMAGGKK